MTEKTRKAIFSRNLNELLENKNLSQRDFAKAIGEYPVTVGSWCRGETFPRVARLEKIAEFFEIPLSALIEETGERENLSSAELELVNDYRKLNEIGKKKSRTYTKDLMYVPDYRKEEDEIDFDYEEPELIAAHGTEGMSDEELDLVRQDIERLRKNGK